MTSTPAGANADTVEMIAARQRVLDAGLFGDLDARLAEILIGRDRIVEVGAGTGHHLARFSRPTPIPTVWHLTSRKQLSGGRRKLILGWRQWLPIPGLGCLSALAV